MKPLFYSDYLEGAHQRILDALQATNMEQTPGYGEDRYCENARELIKKACGAPDADVHFLVGGTQTNATVISSILRPYQGVLCAASGHIAVHETGAIEHGGHKVLTLPAKDGKICARQITDAVSSHRADPSFEHTVQPGMVYISFPTELGTLYSRSELEAISEACRECSIPLFIDGARLGYGLTSKACDLELTDFARLADVFYIGGTKQGALFGEAVVICDDALKSCFRYNIKQNGGMFAKGRLLGIQFGELFKDNLYFDIALNANRQAEKIRTALVDNGFRLYGSSPTNQIFVIVNDAQMASLDEKIGFELWENLDNGQSVIRICTSWCTSDEAVDVLIRALEGLEGK